MMTSRKQIERVQQARFCVTIICQSDLRHEYQPAQGLLNTRLTCNACGSALRGSYPSRPNGWAGDFPCLLNFAATIAKAAEVSPVRVRPFQTGTRKTTHNDQHWACPGFACVTAARLNYALNQLRKATVRPSGAVLLLLREGAGLHVERWTTANQVQQALNEADDSFENNTDTSPLVSLFNLVSLLGKHQGGLLCFKPFAYMVRLFKTQP